MKIDPIPMLSSFPIRTEELDAKSATISPSIAELAWVPADAASSSVHPSEINTLHCNTLPWTKKGARRRTRMDRVQ
jgi:hypothetical protein